MTENVVLEETYDPDYEPNTDEIAEYSAFLGMDLKEDKELIWIAKEGLKAPLPPGWKPCQTEKGDVYYFNFHTGESEWNHPCDKYYRRLYKEEKKKANYKRRSMEETVRRKRMRRNTPESFFSNNYGKSKPPKESTAPRMRAPRLEVKRSSSHEKRIKRQNDVKLETRRSVDSLKLKYDKAINALKKRQAKDMESLRRAGEDALRKKRELHSRLLEEEEMLHLRDIQELRTTHKEVKKKREEENKVEIESLRKTMLSKAELELEEWKQKTALAKDEHALYKSQTDGFRQDIGNLKLKHSRLLERIKSEQELSERLKKEVSDTRERLGGLEKDYNSLKMTVAKESAFWDTEKRRMEADGVLGIWSSSVRAQLEHVFVTNFRNMATKESLLEYFSVCYPPTAQKRAAELWERNGKRALDALEWVHIRTNETNSVQDYKHLRRVLMKEEDRILEANLKTKKNLTEAIETLGAKLNQLDVAIEKKAKDIVTKEVVESELEDKISQTQKALVDNQKRVAMDKLRLQGIRQQIKESQEILKVNEGHVSRLEEERAKWGVQEEKYKAKLLEAEAKAATQEHKIFVLEQQNMEYEGSKAEGLKCLEKFKEMLNQSEKELRQSRKRQQNLESGLEEARSHADKLSSQIRSLKGAQKSALRMVTQEVGKDLTKQHELALRALEEKSDSLTLQLKEDLVRAKTFSETLEKDLENFEQKYTAACEEIKIEKANRASLELKLRQAKERFTAELSQIHIRHDEDLELLKAELQIANGEKEERTVQYHDAKLNEVCEELKKQHETALRALKEESDSVTVELKKELMEVKTFSEALQNDLGKLEEKYTKECEERGLEKAFREGLERRLRRVNLDFKAEIAKINTHHDKKTLDLRGRLAQAVAQAKEYQSQLESLTEELQKAAREKEEINVRYEDIDKLNKTRSKKLQDLRQQLDGEIVKSLQMLEEISSLKARNQTLERELRIQKEANSYAKTTDGHGKAKARGPREGNENGPNEGHGELPTGNEMGLRSPKSPGQKKSISGTGAGNANDERLSDTSNQSESDDEAKRGKHTPDESPKESEHRHEHMNVDTDAQMHHQASVQEQHNSNQSVQVTISDQLEKCIKQQKVFIRQLQEELKQEQAKWKQEKQLSRIDKTFADNKEILQKLRRRKRELDECASRLNEDVKTLKAISRWLRQWKGGKRSQEGSTLDHPDRFADFCNEFVLRSSRSIHDVGDYINRLQDMVKDWAVQKEALRGPLSSQYSRLDEIRDLWRSFSSKQFWKNPKRALVFDTTKAREFVIRLQVDD